MANLFRSPCAPRTQATRSSGHTTVLRNLVVLTYVAGLGVSACASESPTRTIRFPHDHSLGLVSVGELRPTDPMWWQGWQEIGEAKGEVIVPSGRSVLLTVRASNIEHLQILAKLGANDIQAIRLSGAHHDDDSALEYLAGLAGLRLLDLNGTSFTDVGLAPLTKLRSLEALKLSRTRIGEEGLKLVGQLHSLRYLELGSTQIKDAQLVHLRNLSSLEVLWLNYTNVSGGGFRHLTGLNTLRAVHLSLSGVTDEGIAELAKLENLERLFLDYTKVGNAGIAYLVHSKTLRELTLQGTKITNAGLDHVGTIASLEKLELPEGTTTAGLRKLAGLTGLKHLEVVDMRREGTEPISLAPFERLEYLHVPQGTSDDELMHVGKCDSLKELWIDNSSITNDGLAHLASLKSLEGFGLHNGSPGTQMKITVGGLAALEGLPLTFLRLYDIKLDDARLAPLLGFPTLEELHLLELPIEDEDLVAIGRLSRLRYLRFTTETISDGGLAPLAKLPNLENFVPWVFLTDKAMPHIGKMKRLRQLQLKGAFTDAGLRDLENLESLRGLVMNTGGRVTPAGVQRLEARLPHLTFRLRETQEKRPAPQTGATAPDFALRTLDQEELRREDYRGKVLVLYFWATWCSPCKASTPALKRAYAELAKEHRERFAMLGLSLDDDDTRVGLYVQREKIPWPQVCLGRNSQTAGA